jgi:3-oxoacyl-[acyl-carrier protein] reductase
MALRVRGHLPWRHPDRLRCGQSSRTGRVDRFSSVRSPIPGLAISNGLRPGLGMVAKTLSDELGTQGMRVNGLMPALFATSRAAELAATTGDDPQNSLHRRGTPEEFGRVAAFVLSPAASYLTGAMLAIDGGALRTI